MAATRPPMRSVRSLTKSVRKSFDSCGCTPTVHQISGCVSRSEEHTSELQSHVKIVCRLLLEKKMLGDRTTRIGGNCITELQNCSYWHIDREPNSKASDIRVCHFICVMYRWLVWQIVSVWIWT